MKTTITVRLIMSELIYDIESKSYLTGEARGADNAKNKSDIQASSDDENKNIVLRSIGTAYKQLCSKLGDYISNSKTSSSNLLQAETDIVMTLQMPSNFNTNLTDSIADQCHDFVVNSALIDWYGITSPKDVEIHAAKATANIAEIFNAINRRKAPTRILDSTEGVVTDREVSGINGQ